MSDYFVTAEDNTKDIIAVMRVIRKFEATYPSEIASQIGMNYDLTNAVCNWLLRNNYIERLPMHRFTVDPRLKPRLQEFWDKGHTGYFFFVRFKWLGFPEFKLHQSLRTF